MFQIKICGVTSPEAAQSAIQAGADIVGLNFYPPSPRYVTPDQAKAIAACVPRTAGVFVNATASEIIHTAELVSLDWIQLHGNEPPALLADLPIDLPIIRVHCLGKQGVQAIVDDLESCRKHGRAPEAILIDATVSGEYGGTGKTADWPALANHRDWLGNVPLILAGGLRPGNIEQAIAAVRPTAVDTASGVESSPGVKDTQKMQLFCEKVKIAFNSKSQEHP